MLSITSLNVISISERLIIETSSTIGAVMSGSTLYALFCSPGVPPFEFKDAVQLVFPLHGVNGLINSSAYPPSSLMGSLYQLKAYES